MYLFDFQNKLQRLNNQLYVNTDKSTPINEEWSVSGIYQRSAKRKIIENKYKLNYMDTDARKRLEDSQSGSRDKHICGVPNPYIPEFDIFDLEKGTMLAQGWRTILMKLISTGCVDKDKVKKVFKCSSLGELYYDRAGYNKRLEMAREG